MTFFGEPSKHGIHQRVQFIMTKSRVFNRTVLAAVAGSVALQFGISKLGVQAQTGPGLLVSKAERSVTVTSNDAKVKKTAFSASLLKAAGLNAGLRRSLQWPFGARMQSGWDLYSPLIGQTIGTDASPDSPDFAQALSTWQAKSGLPATGILERDTMQAFVKYWQSRRLNRAAYPSADQLLSAPITEFFDRTRDPSLLSLERETYAAYKRMLAAAAKDRSLGLRLTADGELAPDEKFLRIISAFRSREYQASLRKTEPNAGRAALAKNSPHFTGQALDIYVGGEPVTTKDANRAIQVETPAYKWLVKNAHKFGFYPYFYEPWHWEYVPGR